MMLRSLLPGALTFLLIFMMSSSMLRAESIHTPFFEPPPGDTLLYELPFDGEVTVCFDTTSLSGMITFFDSLSCGGVLNSGEVFLNLDNYCMTYLSGSAPGLDIVCLVACSGTQCDTSQYTFAVTNTGPSAVDDNFTVNQNESTNLNILNNDTFLGEVSVSIISPPANGDVAINEDGSLTYNPLTDYCGLDLITYEICTNSELCSQANVVLTVGVDCPDPSLTFYSSFSPNGDNINDFFVIDGLANFPDNVLRVFNRWGAQVFEQRNYENNWDGRWNGENLPDGTYFYYFEDGQGAVSSGYVVIYR